MKTKILTLSRSYLNALRSHLKRGTPASLKAARALGLLAVKQGLETLAFAKVHEDALIILVLPHHSERTIDSMIRRAGTFFTEAITPIEETHRGAQEANVQLKRAVKKLSQRTEELAASNEELRLEIVQRKAVEDSLRISETTTSQLLETARGMQEELRNLSHRLLSAQEEERKKISRELHDVVGQTLTGINLRLATLGTQSTAKAKDLHLKIANTQRLVQKSVDLVHRFARDLRPAMLDDLGLIPALQSHLKGFMERTGIRVGFTAFAGVESLNSGVRTVLYRVAQEALTNIARHAKASGAKVSIRSFGTGIRMEIWDDGQGFELEGTMRAKSSKRLGLLGMRERVEMIGGTFGVTSSRGKETIVCVEIPAANGSSPIRLPPKAGKPTLQRP
ncbi:MAG TPA: histidine kinase [Prosthecobacter sp.]|nr:histidine kinase [Prosthecobacter sp.]